VVGEVANHQACGWGSSLSPRMEILLKVASNTKNQSNQSINHGIYCLNIFYIFLKDTL
jgi:hypothetical protein